jgi:uncharacterized protein
VGATAPSERIEAVDILRGLALFGVLVVNLVASFRVPFLQYFYLPDPARAWYDRVAEMAIRVALEGKALTIFAFLFGVGLAIQHERWSNTRGDARPLLRRRLAVLAAFGLAHLLLVWNGDILLQYALVGLATVWFLDQPDATLERWIPGLIVASMVLPSFALLWHLPGDAEILDQVVEATVVYGTGSWLEIRKHSLEEFLRLAPMLAGLLPQTLGIFLAGVIAWRRGYVREPDAHVAAIRRIAALGLVLGAALTLFNLVEREGWLFFVTAVTLSIAPLVLAAGYAAALILVLRSEGARRALAAFAALGRMAFTNYIAQSLVFGFIFYGYGLGLFGRVGTVRALAIGVAVYLLQIAFSRWWLARFRFGPLEWAWRSLTYGEPQPMRR